MLPAAPLREWPQRRQIIALGQLLEEEVGERRGRLADDHARMGASLDENNGPAQTARDHRQQRAGESGSNNRNVPGPIQPCPPQESQASAGGMRCSRFIRRSRAIRPSRHDAQVGSGLMSHRSAKTRPRPSPDTIFRCGFESLQGGRRKMSVCRQRLHRAVARAGWDEGCNCCVTIEGKIQRPSRPGERLRRRHERRLDEDEDAEVNIVRAQAIGSGSKLHGGHPLVQLLEDLRMDGLEAHRYLQSRAEPVTKAETVLAYQRGMAFDDHALESRHEPHDGRVILRRDRFAVEEAAAVIELDLPGGGKPVQRVLDLRGDGPQRRIAGKCIAPQVAHQTMPWALAVGQEDCRDGYDLARCGAFLLHKKRRWAQRVKLVARRPLRQNPGIALGD